jgi:integrase
MKSLNTHGLRQGELLGLRWEDVDLRVGRLEVKQALQRVRGPYELVDPKTEGSRRAVKLPPRVVEKLREHRARQAAERLRAERWADEWGLVFTTPSGAPLNSRVVLTAFQRKLGEAGLPKVRFHDLRHACSSLLQAGGISPKVVQEQLGHADLSMTLRYTHVLPELAEAAARRMEEVLAAAQDEEGGCQDGCQGRAETGP